MTLLKIVVRTCLHCGADFRTYWEKARLCSTRCANETAGQRRVRVA